LADERFFAFIASLYHRRATVLNKTYRTVIDGGERHDRRGTSRESARPSPLRAGVRGNIGLPTHGAGGIP
jgi:hypothetical protein